MFFVKAQWLSVASKAIHFSKGLCVCLCVCQVSWAYSVYLEFNFPVDIIHIIGKILGLNLLCSRIYTQLNLWFSIIHIDIILFTLFLFLIGQNGRPGYNTLFFLKLLSYAFIFIPQLTVNLLIWYSRFLVADLFFSSFFNPDPFFILYDTYFSPK